VNRGTFETLRSAQLRPAVAAWMDVRVMEARTHERDSVMHAARGCQLSDRRPCVAGTNVVITRYDGDSLETLRYAGPLLR
jgi:hypothetical protein